MRLTQVARKGHRVGMTVSRHPGTTRMDCRQCRLLFSPCPARRAAGRDGTIADACPLPLPSPPRSGAGVKGSTHEARCSAQAHSRSSRHDGFPTPRNHENGVLRRRVAFPDSVGCRLSCSPLWPRARVARPGDGAGGEAGRRARNSLRTCLSDPFSQQSSWRRGRHPETMKMVDVHTSTSPPARSAVRRSPPSSRRPVPSRRLRRNRPETGRGGPGG